MRYVIVILFLTACAALPREDAEPFNKEGRMMLETTRMVWAEEQELPTPYKKKCDKHIRSARLLITEGQEFEYVCGACGPEFPDDEECPWGRRAAACYKRVDGMSLFTQHTTVGSTPIVHEAVHLLEKCSGLGYAFDHTGVQWSEVEPKARERWREEQCRIRAEMDGMNTKNTSCTN